MAVLSASQYENTLTECNQNR